MARDTEKINIGYEGVCVLINMVADAVKKQKPVPSVDEILAEIEKREKVQTSFPVGEWE